MLKQVALSMILLLSIVVVPSPVAAEHGNQTAATDGCLAPEHLENSTKVNISTDPGNRTVTARINADEPHDKHLQFYLREDITVQSTQGLEPLNEENETYNVVGGGTHSLTYKYRESTNRTVSTTYDKLKPVFEGRENWSIVPVPGFNRNTSFTSAQKAHFGDRVAYFGEATVTSERQNCQQIDIVAPKSVETPYNQSAVLETIQYSDNLLGGKRKPRITIFLSPENLAPTAGVALRSNADIVMSAPAVANKTNTIWVHEYIHTRQNTYLASSMEWWQESSATYLSARLSYRSESVSAREYNYWVDPSDERLPDNVVLSNTSTASNFSTYYRGALVLSALDAKLRNQTNGSVTVLDVQHRIAEKDDIDLKEFVTLLEELSGHEYDQWVSKYIEDDKPIKSGMAAEEPSSGVWEVAVFGSILIIAVAGIFFLKDQYARIKGM